jgi:hypothetical protein
MINWPELNKFICDSKLTFFLKSPVVSLIQTGLSDPRQKTMCHLNPLSL